MELFRLLCGLNVKRSSSKLLILFAMLTPIVAAYSQSGIPPSGPTIEQLPFCSDQNERTIGRRLLYVTTLDGTLSALDIAKGGSLHWRVATGPGALISSSIHRLELTNNGQFVRMIPSLSGGIYKFNGETIDPIPITIENLLSTSFKFSDDLIISGGKETRSYGVSARTGKLLYECTMTGCINSTYSEPINGDHDPLIDAVVVVRRQTQTVRAVESRTGVERWNFSVGQHDLELIKSPECHEYPFSDLDMAMLDLDVRVVIPEGIVCAFSKSNPTNLLWKHKFDHPIVSGWKIGSNGALQSIDIFGSVNWLGSIDPNSAPNFGTLPSIYLGMYRKQLYIQESIHLRKEIDDKSNLLAHLMSTESNLPRIPWKPVSANLNPLMSINDANTIHEMVNNDAALAVQGNELIPFDEDNTSASALSVLYASEYVNGNGFYLYVSEEQNDTSKSICSNSNIRNNTGTSENNSVAETIEYNFDDMDAPVRIVVLSLWFWWQEIAMIVFTTAILVNFLIGNRNRTEREIVFIERHIPVPTAIEATETSVVSSEYNSRNRTLSESLQISGDSFTSRFQEDFILERCLGLGGFGVVFEVKNKYDDCKYAVKRITMPSKKESRERVWREVKTLANCEHHNIVRYFQSWVEAPPPGWQEEEDIHWMSSHKTHTIEIESEDECTSSDRYSRKNNILFENKNFVRDLTHSSFTDSFVEFRESSGDCKNVMIDISSNNVSFGGINGEALDCTSLSKSFQIESIHSTNGDYGAIDTINGNKSRSQKRQSITLTDSTHNRPNSLSPNIANLDNPSGKKTNTKVYLYIQMQLCRKESLRDWLLENNLESRQHHIKGIFEQIVDAVNYVHLKGLIHRDLKPSNIFFSQEGQIKIGDFGLVTDMFDMSNIITNDANGQRRRSKHTQQVGTQLYMSPEQLRGQNYDFKVDIYSLGVILFELLVYFSTEMERAKTLDGLRDGKFPATFSNDFPMEHELLKLMLSSTPSKRPSTDQLKQKLIEINWVDAKSTRM